MSVWLDCVLADIRNERWRQDKLKKDGKFPYTCADDGLTNAERFLVLAEDFGEVSHELNEAIGATLARDKLRAELIQVAAVCVAWCEAIDAGGGNL